MPPRARGEGGGGESCPLALLPPEQLLGLLKWGEAAGHTRVEDLARCCCVSRSMRAAAEAAAGGAAERDFAGAPVPRRKGEGLPALAAFARARRAALPPPRLALGRDLIVSTRRQGFIADGILGRRNGEEVRLEGGGISGGGCSVLAVCLQAWKGEEDL